MPNNEDKNKEVSPEGNSPKKETPVVPKEGDDKGDDEFEKELKALESQNEAPKPTKSELDKATFTAKSLVKRIKELGGNPAELIYEDEKEKEDKHEVPVNTSQFVTKLDLAEAEARKLCKSENEVRLTMWWVKNKGMSIQDAHFMANKGKISKTLEEVTRAKNTSYSEGGAGAGSKVDERTDNPQVSQEDKKRLEASGMKYDPVKRAYIGKKVQYRFDDTSKTWVTEKI